MIFLQIFIFPFSMIKFSLKRVVFVIEIFVNFFFHHKMVRFDTKKDSLGDRAEILNENRGVHLRGRALGMVL